MSIIGTMNRTIGSQAPVGGGTAPEPPPDNTFNEWIFFGPTSVSGTIAGACLPVSTTLTANVATSTAIDIRVADAQGNLLGFERVSYDDDTKAIKLKIAAPTFQGANGLLVQISYGDAGLSDASDAAAAHADFLACWRFPAGTDLTGNGHNLTVSNVDATTIFGWPGGAFDADSSATLADVSFLFDKAQGHCSFPMDGASLAGNTMGFIRQGDGSADVNHSWPTIVHLASASVGSNVVYARGKTSTATYALGAAGSGPAGDAVIAGQSQDGQFPTLHIDGVASASGSGSAQSGNLLTVAGGLAIGDGDRPSSKLTGHIGDMGIRDHVVSAAQLELEALCYSDPSLAYAISAESAEGANNYPCACDILASVLVSSVTDIDVIARSKDPNGGQITLVSVGTPTAGSAAVVGGQARYTAPASGGSNTFTFTVQEPGGLQATATCHVTVSGVVSSGAYAWPHAASLPALPASDDDIIVVNASATSVSIPTGSPGQVILVVLPDGVPFTGNFNQRDMNGASLVVIGGTWEPRADQSAFFTGPGEGWHAGRGIACRIEWNRDVLYNGGRPFALFANMAINWPGGSSYGVSSSVDYGDLFRVGMDQTADPAKTPLVFYQRIKQTRAVVFGDHKVSETGPAPSGFPTTIAGNENQPHSDWHQRANKDCKTVYCGEIDIITLGQGIYTKPDDRETWLGNEELICDGCVFRSLTAKPYAAYDRMDDNKLITMGFLPVDVPSGNYTKTTMTDCVLQINPFLGPTGTFSPALGLTAAGGSYDSSGSQVGPNGPAYNFTNVTYQSGDPAQTLDSSFYGNSRRVTGKSQLRSLWPV